MKQYNALKAEYPEAILLFRVGDFYETFGSDAIQAAKILDIVLTKRSNGSASEIELAGFPHHALDTYLPKLVRAGEKVAICEQLEDPKQVKGIVKRGVTELVTPGIAHHEGLLSARQNNYLASIHIDGEQGGLALLDVSTGDFHVAQGAIPELETWIQSFGPSECVYNRRDRRAAEFVGHMTPSGMEDWAYELTHGKQQLCKLLQVANLKGFGLDDAPMAVIAAGALVTYLQQSRYEDIQHVTSVQRLRPDSHLWMDRFTVRNLELFHSQDPQGTSLVEVLDATVTPMGARMLRHWLAMPSVDTQILAQRHDAVASATAMSREDLQAMLGRIHDLERMATRLATGRMGPRELIRLVDSLEAAEEVGAALNGEDAWMLYLESLDCLPKWRQEVRNLIADEPPVMVHKGDVIREGAHEALDQYRNTKANAKGLLDDIVTRESEATGIASLKVAYNNVFGYYLEVRNTYKDKVPEAWIRKQTLVNAERYITEELKTLEADILAADERISELEHELFNGLIQRSQVHVRAVLAAARLIARIDVLMGLGECAARNCWVRPTWSEDRRWNVSNGRHPVIEATLPDGQSYVPNTVTLDSEGERIWILTGPNMSGKSALLRQTAIQSIMAQMGGFVAAESAQLPIMDRLFVRVGASDNISGGESTFMVEMSETASILHGLSSRSLVLLDEIGRGTATYDGISIAQAISEYLHNHPAKPLTIFATHYHELNELEGNLPHMANRHIAIEEDGDRIVFLRTLAEGGTNHSFGIHVAQMAGLPKPVVLRAGDVLRELEAQRASGDHESPIAAEDPKGYQLSMIQWEDPDAAAWREELRMANPDHLTPMEALLLLQRWKEKFASKGA